MATVAWSGIHMQRKLGDNEASIIRVLEYLRADCGSDAADSRRTSRIDRKTGRRLRRGGKLTADIVQEIHGRIEHGESQSLVAVRLGLDGSTVSKVRTGRLWAGSR